MMVGVDDMRVMEVLAEATNTIAAGEVMQLIGTTIPTSTRRATWRWSAARPPSFSRPRRGSGRCSRAIRASKRRLPNTDGMSGPPFSSSTTCSTTAATWAKNLGDDLAEEAHPAAHPHHALRHARAGRDRATGDRAGRARELRARCWKRSALAARSIMRVPRREQRRAPLRAIGASAGNSDYKQSLLELASFAVTRNHCSMAFAAFPIGA